MLDFAALSLSISKQSDPTIQKNKNKKKSFIFSRAYKIIKISSNELFTDTIYSKVIYSMLSRIMRRFIFS